MKHDDDDMVLNEIACHAIANLSEDKEICEILEGSGGSMLIAKALRNFPQSPNLAVDGLSYLENVVTISCEGKWQFMYLFCNHFGGWFSFCNRSVSKISIKVLYIIKKDQYHLGSCGSYNVLCYEAKESYVGCSAEIL